MASNATIADSWNWWMRGSDCAKWSTWVAILQNHLPLRKFTYDFANWEISRLIRKTDNRFAKWPVLQTKRHRVLCMWNILVHVQASHNCTFHVCPPLFGLSTPPLKHVTSNMHKKNNENACLHLMWALCDARIHWIVCACGAWGAVEFFIALWHNCHLLLTQWILRHRAQNG